MTSFDAVASVGMNELSSYQRAGRAAKYPHGHPNHLQALLALPGQQQANGCYFGGAWGDPCTGCHALPTGSASPQKKKAASASASYLLTIQPCIFPPALLEKINSAAN